MWIRSQYLYTLIKCERLSVRKCCDENYCVIGDEHVVLGEYSTEEKAIKVLDMIQEKIIERELMNFGLAKRFSYEHCAFQMPQDDEVKENE